MDSEDGGSVDLEELKTGDDEPARDAETEGGVKSVASNRMPSQRSKVSLEWKIKDAER